jgi:hypothetical protein
VSCTEIGGTNNFSGGSSYGSWIDTSVEQGKYYWYKVKVYDGLSSVESDRSSYDLNNGDSSDVNGAWIGSEPATPFVPTGVTVTSENEGMSVKIAWTGNDPRMTDYFQLYRCTDTSMASCEHHPWYDPYYEEYKDYNFNEFSTYDGDSSEPGKNYYYRVRACAQGLKQDQTSLRCSALSSYDQYTPPPASIPDPPASIAASDGDYWDQILITWSSSPGATYYNLYRENALIASGSQTSYKDVTPNIRGGRFYHYSVAACNALGCSAKSTSDAGSLKYINVFVPINFLLLKQ